MCILTAKAMIIAMATQIITNNMIFFSLLK
jgi:hypothetical protein